MKVLVTGGLGYIGAHVVDELTKLYHDVDVVDSSITLENYHFVMDRTVNLWNQELQRMGDFMSWSTEYDAVVHLAALISVEESTRNPHGYWRNNLEALLALQRLRTKHLIFASTGTAFNPTSPYAWTKVAGERYILDMAADANSHKWFDGHTIFRFYNVSGLSAGIKPTGQPTHLIRICAEAAKGLRDEVKIFGVDYPTADGTCVRDYIHVADIARSISNAVNFGPVNTPYECLGTGAGHSVIDVIQSMKYVTGVDFRVTMAPRRSGDDATTICPSQYHLISLNHDLNDMCRSAFENL